MIEAFPYLFKIKGQIIIWPLGLLVISTGSESSDNIYALRRFALTIQM